MVGWHHSLDGHEFEQTVGDGKGQECLVCCSPWSGKESAMTKQQLDTTRTKLSYSFILIHLEMFTCGHDTVTIT